ncbi:hypothetical protein Hamer_G012526 [Homarus americanus]|uniref:Uncharacterized protein n=1 Tax=Homarus americanus TaxID=6706 RepID=A0A8J5KHJ6_HOMAM|nr:hypothetical protein Hamer_G012526 [Homarus americanus]
MTMNADLISSSDDEDVQSSDDEDIPTSKALDEASPTRKEVGEGDGEVNPLNLINTEVVISDKKGQNLNVEGLQYKIVSYKNSKVADSPTLFLPDEIGHLHRVNSEVKGHVIIKGQPRNFVNNKRIDIHALRSIRHQPPTDIRERNFLSKTGNEKESKSRKRSVVEEMDEVSPRTKKQKKKKKSITS